MLSILVWHYIVGQAQTAIGTPAAYIVKSLSLSWAGVDLFFVLSGFLIGGILMDNRNSKNYYKTFYLRRTFRIIPLFYLMTILFIAGLHIFRGANHDGIAWLFGDPLPTWSYIFFLQNFLMASTGEMGPHWMAISWSLAVEEQFYLILPLIIRLVPPNKVLITLIILVLSAPIIRTAIFLSHANGGLSTYVLLPARWDALFLGVIGAWILRQKKAAEFLSDRKAWLIILMIGCCAFTISMLLAGQGIASPGMTYGGYTVIAVFNLAFILHVYFSPCGILSSFLRNPLLVWVGTASYGIYLFHEPVAGALHSVFRGTLPQIASVHDALITLLALLVTLGMADISSRWIERPFIDYGKRFRYDE